MALKHHETIARMSLADKVAFCSGANFWSTKAFEPYGIPAIRMTDGPHGLRRPIGDGDIPGSDPSLPATCFPTASLTACSWDRGLLQEMGEALAEEALQAGVSIILGPGVNIKRNPLCGRNFEYFSEDPYLAGELATSWIDGMHSKGVGVSLKHFAGNNQENQRMTSDSLIDERTLREIYLPAFEKAVKSARPATIMCAYNRLNGTYCSDNAYLLRNILRDEWGFEGVIVTDWGALNDRVKAFQAGLDLEMPGGVGYFDRAVIEAVRRGDLPEARVDESVDRLLSLIADAMKNRQPNYRYDVDEHHALAKKIAVNSAVLLKNEDHVLPLRRDQRIALIGVLAKEPRYQGAGSSFINPTILSNALDGFDAQGLAYTYYPGYALKGADNGTLLPEAVGGARDCEIAIVFAGLTEDLESEAFDRSNMKLPQAHDDLIERVAAANPNTVVVLVGGSPMEMPWLAKVKAVLHMGLAGQAGGLAVAELLTGIVNPSGKLAESYPLCYEDVPSAGFYETGGRQAQYREGLYVGYRYYDKAQKDVCFPFGHGLSYTTFEYSRLTLSRTEMWDTDELAVTVTVKNSGQVDGAEIVQAYVGDQQPMTYRPEKELRGFAKVFLKAGEAQSITFTLNFRSFACFDAAARAWVVPDGIYAISIGSSSRDIRAQQNVIVHGTPRTTCLPDRPGWYATLSGTVTQADFEALLGHRIEKVEEPRKGEFTMSSTLRDMEGSFAIRMMIRFIEKTVAKGFGGVDYTNPNFKMVMESSLNSPMKTMVMSSGGGMPPHVAQGLVHLANGHWIKGLRSFMQKKHGKTP
jgi:beta-glucosidase